jgi:hypothetical protein
VLTYQHGPCRNRTYNLLQHQSFSPHSGLANNVGIEGACWPSPPVDDEGTGRETAAEGARAVQSRGANSKSRPAASGDRCAPTETGRLAAALARVRAFVSQSFNGAAQRANTGVTAVGP